MYHHKIRTPSSPNDTTIPSRSTTTTRNIDSDTCDWNDIPERKPQFTSKAHVISYTSQHCHLNSSTSSTSRHHHLVRIGHIFLHPKEYLDVLLNELLLYILPTHYTTHLIKNICIIGHLIIVLPVFYYYNVTADPTQCYTCGMTCVVLLIIWIYYNRRILYSVILQHRGVSSGSTSTSGSTTPSGPHDNFIHNPYVTSQYRRPMKSIVLRYHHQESIVRRAACIPSLLHRNRQNNQGVEINHHDDSTITMLSMDNVLCLDSNTSTSSSTNTTTTESTIQWNFRLYNTVQEALDVLQNNSQSTTSPNTHCVPNMTVPSNWTLHPHIMMLDHPRYTNIKYPFPHCEPPLVPSQNPTAIYSCTVTLPPPWFLHADATTTATCHGGTNDHDEYTILVHGIESAYYIFYNGQYIGFAKDSRLSSEFTIPHHLMPLLSSIQHPTSSGAPQATIDIVVVKWCDGTYVEDQDHWYLSGTSIRLVALTECTRTFSCSGRRYGSTLFQTTILEIGKMLLLLLDCT